MTINLPGLQRSASNVLSIWLLQAATLLFALISVPLVTHRFGLEGLGIWLLVQQLTSHMQLLELGLTSSLGRLLSRDHALNKVATYTRHASTAIVILLVMGGFLVLLAVPVAGVFPRVFQLPTHLAPDAEWMLVIAIVVTGLMLPLRSAIGILSSQHRFALQASCDGFALILRVILIFVVCTMLEQYALMALSLAVFVPSLLSSLALFVLANRSAPYVLFSPRTVGIQPLRELLGISLAAMVVTLAAVLLRQGSGILAGYSLGLDSVALIALPVMLVGSVGPFLGIANKLISPIASQLDATRRVDELRMVYLTTVRHTLAAGLLIYVCMIFFAPYLLPLWLGGQSLEPEYVRSIYVNLLLIFGGYCLAIPAFLARAVLVSVGRHKIAARGELISSLVGLVIGYMLMEALEIGVAGMACGIAAAYLIRASGVLVRQLALYFEMSLFHLFVEVWRLPLLTSVPLVLVFIPQLIGNQDLGAAALFGLLALGLWSWLVLRLIITGSYRKKLFRILRKMRLGKASS